MKRGEVYWADLAPHSGSEQQGRRPVVVISHDAFNQTQRLAFNHRRPAFNFPGPSRARTFCCFGAAGCSRSQQGQCRALSSSDHSGSLKANAPNWRIEFSGAESSRIRTQSRDGLAVAGQLVT